MQETTELDTTRMIGHLHPADAHGAEAAEGAAAGCGIGDGLKVAAVEADIFQCARIERPQLLQGGRIVPRAPQPMPGGAQ